jgi:protein associated with RNAse G/E
MPGSHPFFELKHRFDGRIQTFPCHLLARQDDAAVLFYLLSRAGEVATLRLEAGLRTIAYFWTTRAYNIYHWLTPGGATVGFYFNAARDTALYPDRVEWTDLELDLLVLPDRQTAWIDEEEVAGLSAADRQAVESIRQHLQEVHPAVVAWVERESAAYREQVVNLK